MSSGCEPSTSDINIPGPAPAKTAAAAAAMLPSLAPAAARGGGGGGGGGGGSSGSGAPSSTPAKTLGPAKNSSSTAALSSRCGGGGGGVAGAAASASNTPGSGAATPTNGGNAGGNSRIPLPRQLNGLGGGVRRSASMRLRGEKYHHLLGAGASASSFASYYSSSSSPRAHASASASSLWGTGGHGSAGGAGAGGAGRQYPAISEGASWRALRPGATDSNWRASLRGGAGAGAGHESQASAAAAGRYYRSLSLTGAGGGGGGGAFPAAPAASPDPNASGRQQQPPPRRGRGASLSFCPVDDQLLLDDVLDAVRHSAAGGVAGVEDLEDDASSLRSFGSACSAMSCDHAYFARNGTTFSGRRMKYVVHCSPHAGETDEYLTPTQRAARQIRRLKTLLQQAQREINQKDQDIFRLTKEVVELRLFKAALGAPQTHDEDEDEEASVSTANDNTGARAEELTGAGAGVGGGGSGGGIGEGSGGVVDECDAVRAGARATVAALADHLEQQGAEEDDDDGERAHSPRALLLQLHGSDRASSHGGEKTSSPSLADSGHFEDIVTTPEPLPVSARGLVAAVPLASPSALPPGAAPPPTPTATQQRQTPPSPPTQRDALATVAADAAQALAEVEALQRRLAVEATAHARETQQQKERHNDRVEALLQRLSDANDQYCELRSEYERAQDKIRQLEKEAESLRKNMEEHEERHKSMYLKMYMKGQEAARFEHADQVLEFAHNAPGRVSVPELLQQLQVAESELENMKAMYRRIVESRAKKGELDPEITLQFLKSAIYYFLTDKENHQGHLNAIESILGYSESEKLNIEKAYRMYVRK